MILKLKKRRIGSNQTTNTSLIFNKTIEWKSAEEMNLMHKRKIGLFAAAVGPVLLNNEMSRKRERERLVSRLRRMLLL